MVCTVYKFLFYLPYSTPIYNTLIVEKVRKVAHVIADKSENKI